jgi:hypothetical protein
VVTRLTDACHIRTSPASVRQLALAAGQGMPLSLKGFIASPCPLPYAMTVHLKYVEATPSFTGPASTEPDARPMVRNMRSVFATAGVAVHVGSTERLPADVVPGLSIVDVGVGQVQPCSGTPTQDQVDLFAHRGGAAGDDVVLYFVDGTLPANNGCATHPDGRPGAVVTDSASPWTVAHECGHVLGLPHIAGEKNGVGTCVSQDTTRLMTGCGTGNITGTPTISAAEVETMRASPSVTQL